MSRVAAWVLVACVMWGFVWLAARAFDQEWEQQMRRNAATRALALGQ